MAKYRIGGFINRTNPTDGSRQAACDASKPDAAARRRLGAGLLIFALVSLTTACASLGRPSALPSCSNVCGYYNPDTPIGAERTGSRLWIERHLINTSEIGSNVRTVAAGPADGEWEATRMQTPLLVEGGLWKTTVTTGLGNQYPDDVNFDACTLEEPRRTTAGIRRRTVEIYLHTFGPHLAAGHYGLEQSTAWPRSSTATNRIGIG